MTLARDVVDNTATGVDVVYTPEWSSAIHRPSSAAAIWRRQPLPGLQSRLDALEAERLPSARVILRPEDVREAVTQICEASGTPGCPERR